MSQFLGISLFLVIIAGLVLQAGVELPWFLDWIGTLPGDMIIKKNGFTIFVPATSCVIISALLSIVSTFFSKN